MPPQREPIDVEPTILAPPELVQRVAGFHRYLYGIRLASHGQSRRFLPGRATLYAETPPPVAPEEIADRLVRWALEDAGPQGPGVRYLAQLRCRSDSGDSGSSFDRWVTLRTVAGRDGALEIVTDDETQAADHGMAREFMASLETANRIICDQMERIGKMTQHHIEVANSVATMSEAVRESMASNVEQQLKLAEIVAASEADARNNDYKHERLKRVSEFFQPTAERAADFMEDFMRQHTDTTNPNPSATAPKTKAAALDKFIKGLTDTETSQFADLVGADAMAIISAMRTAEDDAAFMAQRDALGALLAPRGDEIRDGIVRILGVTRAMQLDRLLR